MQLVPEDLGKDHATRYAVIREPPTAVLALDLIQLGKSHVLRLEGAGSFYCRRVNVARGIQGRGITSN